MASRWHEKPIKSSLGSPLSQSSPINTLLPLLWPAMLIHFGGPLPPVIPIEQLLRETTPREDLGPVIRALSSEITNHRRQIAELKGDTTTLRMERTKLIYDMMMLIQCIKYLEHKPPPKRRWRSKKRKRCFAIWSPNNRRLVYFQCFSSNFYFFHRCKHLNLNYYE